MLAALVLALAAPVAETRIAAAEARLAALDRQRDEQRAALAATQAPLARLLATMQRFALRPPAFALAQPRSIDDLIHANALLSALRPVVAARAAALRTDMERTRIASAESAQALAAISVERSAYENALNARLMRLPVPPDIATLRPVAVYDLAARGVVVSGTGERAEAGWRTRGLTLLTAPGARVAAPGPGRIAYAGAFGGYGAIVILDHGHGWTTLLAGLDGAEVSSGAYVQRGVAVGHMGDRARRLTIELRHNGRPVDVAGMAAQ
jgi:septal ring factor EnvC (AmiA/AmiB activator)